MKVYSSFILASLVLLCAFLSSATDLEPSQFAPGKPMVITVGNDVGWQVTDFEAARTAFIERGELRSGPEKMLAHWKKHGTLYAEHGATAFEPYVKWMLLEPEEGVWEPAFYDAELTAFKENGLKWVPFLIGGPAYATPPWFKESDESVFAIDLKTGHETRDQSIWNPHLKPRIRAWLTRFFVHYEQEDMQAVLLGISGVFGESIYTAEGNIPTQVWDGKYHQHLGWWCGDPYAKADFIKTMRLKYKDIGDLNKAWQCSFGTFDEVMPFVPERGHSMRARLDMVRWYMGSMTDYAAWWVKTTRELAPNVPVLLCTGGSGIPELGADMTAQAKMVASHGAGIRITNESSDYATNFYLTNIVGSACRHYNTYFGYEPAGAVDTNGITARIYNAVVSGAWDLFHYDNPPRGERGNQYKRYLELMQIREPRIEVGFFWSRTSADLKLHRGLPDAARSVRDLVDVAFIDEQLIADGALDDLRVFVWASGTVTEADTVDAIQRAVEKGLTLVVSKNWEARSPEGELLFPFAITSSSQESERFDKPKPSSTLTVLPLGDGAVIQGSSKRAKDIGNVLGELLRNPASFGVSALAPESSIDARLDKVYIANTSQDILIYNQSDSIQAVDTPAKTVQVPPHTILSIPHSVQE